MKIKALILFLIIVLLITGCGKNNDGNVDILDKTQDVLEDIEFAKKNTAINAAYNLRKAVELYYMNLLIESLDEINVVEFSCSKDGCISDKGSLDLSGLVPTSGKIMLHRDGSIVFSEIVINGYNCDIPNSGNIICSK